MGAQNKTVIIIAGPTAVGKTSVAIEVAKYFNAEIISADSRQCYKELNIGVARPSEHELAQVPHHFIASHSIHEKVTAGSFEKYALEKVNHLFYQHQVVVMVGGTGLYIKAFAEGIDEMPVVPELIRNEIVSAYHTHGLEWLQEEVKKLDPVFYKEGEIENPQRLMRALEIFKATGKSIQHFRKGEKKKRDFNIVKVALELPREALIKNINLRVDQMMEEGLLDEVKHLVPYQQVNALQTVGYVELFDFINGEMTLPEGVERIKINTRQYAKRQMTWFKKDKEYQWFPPDKSAVIQHLKHLLS